MNGRALLKPPQYYATVADVCFVAVTSPDTGGVQPRRRRNSDGGPGTILRTADEGYHPGRRTLLESLIFSRIEPETKTVRTDLVLYLRL